MSDEAIQEEFEDLEPEPQPEPEPDKQELDQEPEPQPEPEPDEDPELVAAREAGWVTLDEWTEGGGDPDLWKGYKAFNKDGELYSSLKSARGEITGLKRTMSESLQRNNTFYKAQVKSLQGQKAELERKLDDAVSLADVDTAKELRSEIKELDSTIDEMETESERPAEEPSLAERLQTHPTISNWVDKNPWIRDANDERSTKAAELFAERFQERAADFASLDALVDDVIQHVNAQMRPAKNPNREKAPISTGGKKTLPGGKKKGLSMSDLTADEKNMWHDFKDVWTEEEFLKTVEESRV